MKVQVAPVYNEHHGAFTFLDRQLLYVSFCRIGTIVIKRWFNGEHRI